MALQDRPLAAFDLGFLQIGLGLLQIRDAFFGVADVRCPLCFDLMCQVFEFGLSSSSSLISLARSKVASESPDIDQRAVLSQGRATRLPPRPSINGTSIGDRINGADNARGADRANCRLWRSCCRGEGKNRDAKDTGSAMHSCLS